ncbi:MAG TPA: sodium ion-translocating decarboxylase subunit beta [Candidatus Avimonas sp.]|mgnify:CR=1 FL=1|jgi:sodium ion-translocating decarboxylase beta subunit|nr:sodium ion-translocating decarboxylase subunit beta [Candidatus Avimonas sp.]HQA16668.1 sodium ion-translocating decarboxylase subunit beta [Candidatus Avimonas sp.]HQD38756.1 sodium ion-translocating decarboxylase subunit beta [Candidatus Avimonas sp.]
MDAILKAISDIWNESGYMKLFTLGSEGSILERIATGGAGNLIMIVIACVLIYLAIKKEFEPLLLLPIAFGMLLVNLPLGGVMNQQINSLVPLTGEELVQLRQGILAQSYPILEINGSYYWQRFETGGLLWYLYQGVKYGIYPPLIFLGIGAMTDFGPLIANPKSFLLGAAAQFGIFATFFGAVALGLTGNPSLAFTEQQAASIGIIGGADGPTAIWLTSKLAPELLGPIAVAAYSYMALVPIIQPPIMRLLTTKKERSVVMEQLRPVSKTEKILFPIFVTIIVVLLLPSAAPLVGMLMLGNLFRESGVVDRIFRTAQNELMNIVTIFIGITVGATANAATFLQPRTLLIIVLGLLAFAFGTAGGVLLGKLMYYLTGGKVNPLIGSAGVSAVPMAARVSQKVGQQENPDNFLLMHAMGPNVAGVIGSAVAAGVLLTLFG